MLTRSTSLCATSSCQSLATCSMPNSLAMAAARSRLRLAIATIFAPMQSRKPGIWVVRANPVPIIPIPTGDFFMAAILYHTTAMQMGVSLECGALAPLWYTSRNIPKRCQGTALQGDALYYECLGVASGEARDHVDKLAGADGFGDVHLIACREC